MFRTYIAPTTRSLLRHVSHFPAPPATSINLFALSAHSDDLQDAVAYLISLPNAIGGLTASPYKGVQLSIASYPATHCLPFRSTVPGISQAKVGRVRTYRPPTREDRASEIRLDRALAEETVNWDSTLSEGESLELPSGLRHVRNKSSISSFLYLSDRSPEGLLNSLRKHFPAASQLGLIGSSTPFITGRPFTLFKGSKIFSDGAVGLAVFNQGPEQASIHFANIRAISEPMEVTQAQTNLIESLDNGNPVQSLILAMKANGSISKDQDIYLVVLDESFDSQTNKVLTHGYSQVYKITAGGSSRGSISLDATEGPRLGAKVQFAIAVSQNFSQTSVPVNQTTPTWTLNTISDSYIQAISTASDVREIENVFLGTSENGFVWGPSLERPWICTVSGATASLRWAL